MNLDECIFVYKLFELLVEVVKGLVNKVFILFNVIEIFGIFGVIGEIFKEK